VGVGKSSILGRDVEKIGYAQKGWDCLMKTTTCFQEHFSRFYLLQPR
jgi:hypothetical protein